MLNKSLLLTGLATGLLSNAYPIQVANSISTSQSISSNDIVEEDEGCTVMYVGKGKSVNGHAIIARSSDAGPNAMHLHTELFKHNQLANQVVKGKNGFSWKMPSTTYKYISTPRNLCMNKGLHWEASAINENGVGVSATLSCAYGSSAVSADPIVGEGITEDNITQIIGATATSARNGIKTIGEIIKEQGNKDANAILVIDQNEAWYMEMYTGHQYIAIKLPDDKVCTIGNEFMLDSLANIFDGHVNWDDDVIYSEELFSLPRDGKGDVGPFAVYDTGYEQTKEPEHLDLFRTYAKQLTDDPEHIVDNNYNHRRTWRGLSMFGYENYNSPGYQPYEPTTKYSSFFTPYRDLDINDVKDFMRDRFESILNDQEDPDYPEFIADSESYNLRPVAVENAYQIHIIQSFAELPKDMACVEYLCITNSAYAPFIPLSCAVNSLDDHYSYITDEYKYDENAASCIFKFVNRLCAISRKYYGLPVIELIENYEDIWNSQFWDVIDKVKSLDKKTRTDILTNFTKNIQAQAIDLARQIGENLLVHVEDDLSPLVKDPSLFKPFLNLKDYAQMYGWSYKQQGRVATLHNDKGNYHDIVINATYDYTQNGKIKVDDQDEESIKLCYLDGNIYIDVVKAQTYISDDRELEKIDVDDWKSPSNKDHTTAIVLGIAIPVVVIAGVLIVIALKKRKQINTPIPASC